MNLSGSTAVSYKFENLSGVVIAVDVKMFAVGSSKQWKGGVRSERFDMTFCMFDSLLRVVLHNSN